MATIAEIRTAIENFVTNHGPKFIRRQERYFANHGYYWQGVLTPATIPDDGVLVAANYSVRPTDHPERWSDIFINDDIDDRLPASIPMQISVDVYGGPRGQGWSFTVYATKAGTLYWRTWHVGPETERQTDWQSRLLV